MTPIHYLTIAEAAQKLRTGTLKSVDAQCRDHDGS